MSERFLPTPTLDREFLPIRAKILEIAAALDRIERSAGLQSARDGAHDQSTTSGSREEHPDDHRWQQLQEGIQLLLSDQATRAERVQLLFSRPYDEQWRETLQISVS